MDIRVKNAFSIRFFGVRGSIPCANTEYMSYGGNTSCVQLVIPDSDEFIILDCGSGIRKLGEKLVLNKNLLNGKIFVTHAHWDHIQGFPFFKPIYSDDRNIEIYYPHKQDGDCKRAMTTQLTPSHFPVTPEMLNATINYIDFRKEIILFNGYEVSYKQAVHPVNTAMYKLKIGEKTVVYAPDNELNLKTQPNFLNEFSEFIQNVDVLIHDANFDRISYSTKQNWGHSAWEDVVEVAAKCNVKHLFLTHHDPTSTDEIMDIRAGLLSKFEDKFESVQFAKEGKTFDF